MSQSVNDVLSAITVASEALNREPQLRSQIADLETTLNKSQAHALELELNCQSYNKQIDELNSKVRSLEVERDDAQFRALQLEDAFNSLVNNIHNVSVGADESHLRLNPPKPEPVVEQVKTEVRDYDYDNPPRVGHIEAPTPLPNSQGQSVADPSYASSTEAPPASGLVEASDTVSASLDDKPYAGKKWSETWKDDGTRVWSRTEWFEGGGTEETYNQ